jgi:hypothetical protein
MSAQDHPTAGDSPAAPPADHHLPTPYVKGYSALLPIADHAAALLLNTNPNQSAPASSLTGNNNTISKQNVEDATTSTTSTNKAIKHKQKKGKHRITKRSTNSKGEAIAQMKAKR